MRKSGLLLVVIFQLAVFANLNAKNTYYVKVNGAGDRSGVSWSNASDDLQAMINQAEPDDAVFVAAGDYFPNKVSNHLAGEVSPYNRNNAFVLKKDVKIYGSFPANANDSEHTTIDCRFSDGWILKTYLLGHLKDHVNWDDFAYHVVISAGDAGSALLDGIFIANGNSNGDSNSKITVNGYTVNNSQGGGMYNASSSPTLYGVIIQNNTGKSGSGMYNDYSSPTISETVICDNYATNMGGGIYNFNFSSPSISDAIIKGNIAETNGGGIVNRSFSSPEIINTVIDENEAENQGGGMYNDFSSAPSSKFVNIMSNKASFGGGIYNNKSGNASFQNVFICKNVATEGAGGGVLNVESNPVFMNTVIAENTAKAGGAGMYNKTSSPILVNVTLSRNSANTSGTYGGAMRNSDSSRPKVYNSIVWDNTGYPQVYNESNSYISCYNSLVETVTTGTNGNLAGTTNPLFAKNGDTDHYYSLLAGSPCVDKGSNTYYTDNGGSLTTDKDLKENPRFSGSHIDMGAYEVQQTSDISVSEAMSISYQVDNGYLNIPDIEADAHIQLWDINGKQLYETTAASSHIQIRLPQRGIYILKIQSGNKLFTRKIIW